MDCMNMSDRYNETFKKERKLIKEFVKNKNHKTLNSEVKIVKKGAGRNDNTRAKNKKLNK